MIEDLLVIVTKQTLDRFLKEDNPADLIALYVFYYYTAKWQKTNQPKCTTSYVATGLKWSEPKVRKVKKVLVDMGFIEDITATMDGKITGHYIKLNYIMKESNVPPLKDSTLCNSHGVENMQTNALSNGNRNALSTNNSNALNNIDGSAVKSNANKKQTKFIPPTYEQIVEYINDNKLDVDADFFYKFFTEGDWKDSKGNPVKSWKQKLLTWHRSNKQRADSQKTERERCFDELFNL